MSKECYEAIQFAIANAESIEGQLICQVVYDNAMQDFPTIAWRLDCGKLSILLSGQEVALEVIKMLPQA